MPYSPVPPTSSSLEDATSWVYRELLRISAILNAVEAGRLEKTYVVPAKPREGDIRFADGTNWNPGGGKGIYFYDGTSWVKL